jgi:Inner membrane component of T3SS, cytoplasmic domain
VRFEVRYPNGALHEVELEGTLAVVGRDPSCDLVLNDAKCSRRHAVIEAGPEGLLVRDSGSANGVYVNGKKTDRANVKHGDEIRVGEVVLKVLPEEMPGTLVMGPDELPDAPAVSGDADTVPPSFPEPRPVAAPPPAKVDKPAPLPRMPSPPPVPTPAPRPAPPPPVPKKVEPPPRVAPPRAPVRSSTSGLHEALPRPLTGMVLAALWLLAAICYFIAGVLLVSLGRSRGFGLIWPAAFLVLAMVSVVVGVGLWMRAPWARLLQIATAGLGLLTCVATPLSAAAIAYMLRGSSRIHFSGRDSFSELSPEEAAIVRADSGEGLFMAGVLVGLLASVVLLGVGGALGLPALLRPAN